ncbi:MBL fold metallo-hydrolase [Agaribacterium haliotis]|uniref:MBL fold metallo-hydrolase n=1 Tax=Agaribacterium haliotis TaxID=2013869 RepID=UPI001EFDCCA5|nr:MBL fold metallo-hydrolase [Agaribacterium haliotis]
MNKLMLRGALCLGLAIATVGTGAYMTSEKLGSHSHDSGTALERIQNSPQYHSGRFHNKKQPAMAGLFEASWQWLKQSQIDKKPAGQVPLETISTEDLSALNKNEDVLYRLGHSSILLQLDGKLWLTDPVFSERASPFSFMGPKRFHPSPLSIDSLPAIEGVILSHNHYDHMDKHSIKALIGKVKHFYVPLGLGADLQAWGVDKQRISELDWWQSVEAGSVRLTATPSQHFSGRSLSDRDKSLWASWVIQSQHSKIFFSGDSGYFDGFKEIGERLGPFDISLMENGAYNELWQGVHMMPEESVQAHIDVRAQRLLPIHNGTFDLAMHAWYEPFERLLQSAAQHGVEVLSPAMGQKISIKNSEAKDTARWWRALIQEGQGKQAKAAPASTHTDTNPSATAARAISAK